MSSGMKKHLRHLTSPEKSVSHDAKSPPAALFQQLFPSIIKFYLAALFCASTLQLKAQFGLSSGCVQEAETSCLGRSRKHITEV